MKKETKTVQKTVHTEFVARFADPAILPDSMERHLESVTAKFESAKKTAAPVTAAKTKISRKAVRKHAVTVKGVKTSDVSANGNKGPAAAPTAVTIKSEPVVARTRLSSRTQQIVTVVASGSSAHVEFWEKSGTTWIRQLSANGHVGSAGVGATREGMSKTPYGAYTLGFAFGTENPGTSLPFRQITPQSWWVEDSKNPNYNSWQEGAHFNDPSEHLADYPVQYHYAVVINYNTARTPYAGSGFFLHCDNGRPTAGCVSIPTAQMRQLMQMLRPGAYIVNVNSTNEISNF